jgi:hypothetical protein
MKAMVKLNTFGGVTCLLMANEPFFPSILLKQIQIKYSENSSKVDSIVI